MFFTSKIKETEHMEHVFDITVIGGGPVGMFTAFYAGLRNADVHLIESLPELGGQTGALYPEKEIYDVAGFPHIKGKLLVQQLESQMRAFDPQITLDTAVTNIAQAGDQFKITTSKATYYSKSVIIAIGNGAFAPRKLAFDYDSRLDHHQVDYFVHDLDDYKDLDVAIAGGGDSAVDWALTLNDIAKSVTIIHRRDKFRGLESSVKQLMTSNINVKTPFLLEGLGLDDGKLKIDLKKMKSDDHDALLVDKLLVNYGFTSDSRILRQWAIDLQGTDVLVDNHMQTSRPLIYSVGDSAYYNGKVKLIASGFGEVPTAVNHALETIYPERKQPLHSTSLFN
ncbi:trxB1 protein [Agrilactobacillus composti DSM 18527 = JCM 14202]|uniref:Ferredoxin--NADP reductase n=2 Tax=Agrilactobacillus TaxID=2767875 RepID=A0A0R1XY67_9LACO|nr:trxB1 protein [Agrilactobacillus composti DSM 18527 = JCM 14202]